MHDRRARARAKERKADIAPPPRDSVGDSTIPLSSSDQDASPFIPRLIVHNEILDAAIPPDASQPYSKSDPEEAASTIAIIVTRLTTIFNDVALYKKLLSSRDSDAQQLLDLFQWLLDAPAVDSVIRRSLIVAMQRLSRKTGLYPACYSLQGVEYGGDPVAAGSYADIYKGTMGDQPVCMKVIRVYQTTQVGHFLKACSKEAILWGQLSHANLLPIYGLYRLNTRICLVSSWMEHGVITQYLANYPDADRLLLVLDVTQGLAYLHENKIIHGDLKGVNILVSKSGRACVADFGLSSISDANILAWTSNSSAASKGGSMRWQAPELFDLDNDELVQNDEASDMYAWACVCYEIFTGNVPFSHLSRESAVLLQVQAGRRPPRPLKSSPPWLTWGLREDMWSLMDDCWNGDSTKRPTVQNVLARLEPMLPRDRRPADSGEMLTPAQFRETMRAPLDVRSILETLKQVSNPP
ncbi:kinase-like domain-containing protein [Lyophyllum atratum]|nr:kinase-like domain-containing protein [Lyophyllum atratum]